jgi:hypothetical protein
MQVVTYKILDGVEVDDEFKYIIGELVLASKVVKCVKPGCRACKEHGHTVWMRLLPQLLLLGEL